MVFYHGNKHIDIFTKNDLEKKYLKLIKNSNLSEKNKLKLIYVLEWIEDENEMEEIFKLSKEFKHDMPLSFEDIYYYKQLEKGLYEILSSVLDEGIMMFDNSWEIIFSNYKALDIFGIQKYICTDDVFGKILNQEMDFKDLKLNHSWEEKEISFYDKDWELKFVNFSFHEVNSYYENNLFVGIFKDITSQKYVENIKENAVNTIKHDLKWSVWNIKYITELFLSENEDELNTSEKEYIELIEYVANNLLYQLKDFLNIAKIYTGDYEIQKEKFNLFDIIINLKKEFESTREKDNKKIQLKNINNYKIYDILKDFSWEKGLIISIFVNIIKNALEYTPEWENISISVQKNDNILQFIVRNPLPVDEKIVSYFFQPYISWKERGWTGLWTYSAKVLTEAHWGSVDVLSSEEEWTFVEINLPYK